MQAYRLCTTITDPQQITLTELPINLSAQAQSLFRQTQALP